MCYVNKPKYLGTSMFIKSTTTLQKLNCYGDFKKQGGIEWILHKLFYRVFVFVQSRIFLPLVKLKNDDNYYNYYCYYNIIIFIFIYLNLNLNLNFIITILLLDNKRSVAVASQSTLKSIN